MLTLDLARLMREGTLPVEADVPSDHALLDGLRIGLDGPLRVRLTATSAGTGEIVVRGRLEATLDMQCRRCLEPVQVAWNEKITWVYAPFDELETDDETDVRPLPASVSVLDLKDAVREELFLGADHYVVCDEACKGLCPVCGVNRNQETCACILEERDPRWDALRALKSE